MSAGQLRNRDLSRAVPDLSGSLRLSGLEDTVSVFRDAYGIPHVKAQTVHDAFFGQAFATAQDRLWHMDHDRRVGYGRWAEYAGPDTLAQDIQMRRLQVRASAEADYEAVNSKTRAMLDAYAEGVNAFIETTRALPIEYTLLDAHPEPWQPWDCLAVFKARHILMGVFEGKLWRARLVTELGHERAAEILPGYQPGHLLITPPGAEYLGPGQDPLAGLLASAEVAGLISDIDSGSNNWALSGSRTASSKPLLAGDPHRALEAPNVYYQNHVACPEFDAIGLSFPGLPGFPHFGHNTDVAWCVTHAGADYQDLYIERFKEGEPELYDYRGEWRRASVSRETIQVRGGAPVELDVTVTHHGPVIVGEPAAGHAISFKYTGTSGPNLGFQCLPRMLGAASADEIEEAMRDWVDPCNNFVYADVHGDIGYLNRGKLPLRPMANAWLPVPGWTGENEWNRFVPFEELARARNPESGQIVTANNKIAGDDYPHYIGLYFAPEYRAHRITERLKTLREATVQDMASVHAERVSIPASAYSRVLAGVSPLDDLSARALGLMKGWDGGMEADAVAPTIYSSFRIALERRVLEHLLGPLAGEALGATGRGAPIHLAQLRARLATAAGRNESSMLPPGTDWPTLAAEALADGLAYLKDRVGDDMDSWTWGTVHFTRPVHPLSTSFPEMALQLDPPSLPVGGDGDTPQSGSYQANQPFVVTGTSVARYVFDTADWDNSRWVVPLGASGHPGSPHYVDQAPVWGGIDLVPMLYDWKGIEKGAETRQELAGPGSA